MGFFDRFKKQAQPEREFDGNSLTTAFEEAVPQLVARAWDYADRSPELDTVGVIMHYGNGNPDARPVYGLGGAFHHPAGISNLAVEDTEDAVITDLSDIAREVYNNVEPDLRPHAVIIRYTTADGAMGATFEHDDSTGDAQSIANTIVETGSIDDA